MVDTIKFSEFASGGDLEPNQTTVGLDNTETINTKFNNPFPLLPPGTTGDRPAPAANMYYRLRFNTTTELYEYYSPTAGDWVLVTTGSVISLSGTPNEVDIDNTDPENPIVSLSATIDTPGSFTIGSTIVLDSIIDDDTFATATATNIPTSESVKAYVDAASGHQVDSVVGTTNEIDVDATDPANPILSLSATLDAPGTFTIQGTVALDAIIDDDTFATATATNIPTAESVKAYVDATAGDYLPLAGGTMAGDIDMDGNNIANIGYARFLDGANYVGFIAPTLASDTTYTLPDDYPTTTGFILSSTDGGVMSWVANTAGSMVSVVGTTNEVDVDATDPQNPILSLSATLNAPGTFTIQGTVALDAVIDDDTFATATDSNIPTSESVKAYVDANSGGADAGFTFMLMGG